MKSRLEESCRKSPNLITLPYSHLAVLSSALWGPDPSYFLLVHQLLLFLSHVIHHFSNTLASTLTLLFLYPGLVEPTSKF